MNGPQRDIEKMRRLLEAKECATLHNHLSAAKRAEISSEAFELVCKEKATEVTATFILLEKEAKRKKKGKKGRKEETGGEATYKAFVKTASGATVLLVYEDGSWKIDSDILDFYPRSTPAETLASFVKAYRAKRWDLLAEMIPSRYTAQEDAEVLKKHWSEEPTKSRMEALVTVLQNHLQGPFEIEGNRAVLEFAPGHRVELVKEKGRWVLLLIQ